MTTHAIVSEPEAAHDSNPAASGAVAAGRAPNKGGAEHLKLSHAFLKLYEPSQDGSLDKPGPKFGEIEFQFNPDRKSVV